MAKRMSDDEVSNYVFSKMFGDLDGLEAQSLFDQDDTGVEDGTAEKAEPESDNSGGIKITVEPLMKGAEESGRTTDTRRDGASSDDDEDKDKLKGIGGMSSLMSQLHGSR